MAPSMRTRSSTKKDDVDLTYYTTLEAKDSRKKIQVISKRKFKDSSENHAKLQEKLDRIGEDTHALSQAKSLTKEKKTNTVIWVTHFNVFVYAASFFIQVGTLPYLTRKLGADPALFGQLQTVFAVVQLLGSPIYGRLGDMMGEKITLALAFGASGTSYFILAIADDMYTVFLSRLPSVFMHVMQGSQMLLTHVSNGEERAVALSRLGFSYGIGMVVGPTFGGFLTSHYGEQMASFVAAIASFISFTLVILFIPDFVKGSDQSSSKSGKSIWDLKGIGNLLKIPGTRGILWIKLLCGVPIGVLQSMFSVVAIDQFGLTPEQNGMMLSYIGGISMLMQGLGISFLKSFFHDSSLMTGSVILLTITYYVLTLLNDSLSFVVLLFPLTCCLCLVNSILTASVTKKVPETDTGTVLGLNMAANSSIRTVAPTLGGYMLNTYGFNSLGYLGLIFNGLALWTITGNKMTF